MIKAILTWILLFFGIWGSIELYTKLTKQERQETIKILIKAAVIAFINTGILVLLVLIF